MAPVAMLPIQLGNANETTVPIAPAIARARTTNRRALVVVINTSSWRVSVDGGVKSCLVEALPRLRVPLDFFLTTFQENTKESHRGDHEQDDNNQVNNNPYPDRRPYSQEDPREGHQRQYISERKGIGSNRPCRSLPDPVRHADRCWMVEPTGSVATKPSVNAMDRSMADILRRRAANDRICRC
jgi:hypothetical protein